MEITETLRQLTELGGVSGDELNISGAAAELLREYADEVSVDPFGNVTGFVRAENPAQPVAMLDAHLDRIGMRVTYIDEKGFLKAGAAGGLDMRVLLAQSVTVWGKAPVKGVVSTLPPHVSKDHSTVPEIGDISIDIGMTKEEAEKLVSLGDAITVNGSFRKLCAGRVSAAAADDRCGICAVLRALELLNGKKPSKTVAVSFSAQEETGERGVKQTAFRIMPDEAIAVDVSFGRTPDSAPHETAELGSGVMIGFSAALDKEMSQKLLCIAEEKGIPHTCEVMPSTTGTNADAAGVSGKGVKCATLSVPIRYMHTAVETVDPADIEAAARLMYEYIK